MGDSTTLSKPTVGLTDGGATIIAAILAATTAAAIEVGKAATSQPGSPVYGVITNQSNSVFSIYTFSPVHGHSFEGPDLTLNGRGWVEEQFMKAVKGKYGNNPTQDDVDREMGEWIKDDTFSLYADKCVTKYGGTGDGAGYEQVIVLSTPDEGNAVVALVVRKIPGGHYGAGVSISNNGWYDYNGDKPKGKNILKHIQKIHTNLCQYSDGGPQISVQLGQLKVTITAPGEKIEIQIDSV